MTKRKLDNCLDDLIVDVFKKIKCERTVQLFQKENKNFANKTLKYGNHYLFERFMNYLKSKDAEKKDQTDDLGFEINFGAFEPIAKVSKIITYLSPYKCGVLSLTSNLVAVESKNCYN